MRHSSDARLKDIFTERELVRILKNGTATEDELAVRRSGAMAERERMLREADAWEKLDPCTAAGIRSLTVQSDLLRDISRQQCVYHIVRDALLRINPEYRELLTEYYEQSVDPASIAKKMKISSTTFWRRRRYAVGALIEACEDCCKNMPDDLQYIV
ncbi:MAG: hypothetical protein Q4G47_02540 [Lachnospiraceae bacterium]|nr:hypothetical protein [Lachnospiraceae bacterium]